MNTAAKNKTLTWIVVLLLIGNVTSIAIFWINRNTPALSPKGTPAAFLIKELKLDKRQQEQLEILVTQHKEQVPSIRKKVRESKEALFDLLKQYNVSDSVKKAALKSVSINTEILDSITFEHFKKIRELCTAEQKIKFDQIIHQVTSMKAQQRPGDGPGPRGSGRN